MRKIQTFSIIIVSILFMSLHVFAKPDFVISDISQSMKATMEKSGLWNKPCPVPLYRMQPPIRLISTKLKNFIRTILISLLHCCKIKWTILTT